MLDIGEQEVVDQEEELIDWGFLEGLTTPGYQAEAEVEEEGGGAEEREQAKG